MEIVEMVAPEVPVVERHADARHVCIVVGYMQYQQQFVTCAAVTVHTKWIVRMEQELRENRGPGKARKSPTLAKYRARVQSRRCQRSQCEHLSLGARIG